MRSGSSALWRDMGTLFGAGTTAGLSDEQLLERFVTRRAEVAEATVAAEAAFAAIVHRHGPMVLAVCRRLLTDPRDAEDAFQATFLVLARRAGSLSNGARLGGWLRRVATRVATRTRAEACRRKSREGTFEAEPVADPAAERHRAEEREAITEEVRLLPELYRAAIELCHLEGLTVREAGRRLGCPVGTVCVRLSRGRGLLKSRLARRGLAPSSAVLVTGASEALAAVPQQLLNATVRAVVRGTAGGAGLISPHVLSLTQGVLRTMFIAKLKWVAPVVVAIGVGFLGSSGHSSQAAADEPEPQQANGSRWDGIEAEIQGLALEIVKLRRAGESEAAYKVSIRLAERIKAWQGMLQADRNPTPKSDASGDKIKARELLLSAQKLIADGKLDEAKGLIAAAHNLEAKWGRFDFNPDKAAALWIKEAERLKSNPQGDAVKLYGEALRQEDHAVNRRYAELLQQKDAAAKSQFGKVLKQKDAAAKSQEQRLQDVEQKLDRILKALEKTDTPKPKDSFEPKSIGQRW
jgi:RNA polymerase sigma factor (sigma-70 family)